MSNIFKDKTEMPGQPDLAVSSVKVPGEVMSGASRDMKMAGVMNWPELKVVSVDRPRFGHKV